jgi:hypothetical protein
MAVLLLTAAAFVFLSIPALWNKSATAVSLFNHDVASYATVSRFLMEFTRASSVGFVGQGFHWFNQYPVDWYFGPVSSTALLSAYLGMMPDQDITLCINLFAALGTTTLFLLLHNTLQTQGKIALLGVALWAFHPAFQYLVFEGFFAQIVAMSLGVLIFWATSKLIVSREMPQHLAAYFVLLCCFTWGLLLTYQHMLPFVWIFTGVYTFILAVAMKDIRPLLISAIGHAAAFTLFAMLCPPRAIAFLGDFQHMATVQAGWFMPFFAPDYLAGLSYQNSPFTTEDPRIHVILAPATVAVSLFLLLVALRNARDTTIGLWVSCSIVYAGVIILAVNGQNGLIGGYKSFKFATFFLPFFTAAVASLFDLSRLTSRSLTTFFKVGLILVLTIGYSRADFRLLNGMKRMYKKVEPEYRDLLSIDGDNEVESVNILGPDGWEIGWASYFLLHKKLYMENASYWPRTDLNGSYDLQDSRANSPTRHLPSATVPKIRRLNDRFSLIGPIPQ